MITFDGDNGQVSLDLKDIFDPSICAKERKCKKFHDELKKLCAKKHLNYYATVKEAGTCYEGAKYIWLSAVSTNGAEHEKYIRDHYGNALYVAFVTLFNHFQVGICRYFCILANILESISWES